MYHLIDFKTKQRVNPSNLVFTGDENPWEVVMDLDEIKSRINIDYFKKSPPFVSKYLPFMPIKDFSNFVSLKEGSTPLIESTRLGQQLGINLFFKLESQNPTGSFKDRGSAVELTIAKELNVKAIAVASTGNMAASCSCYAASAGIPCFVFVPEGTPPSKLSQVISYGGRIVQVKGSYGDAAALAKLVAEKLNFYLAGDYAFRVEGQKTAAFELVDQLYYKAPDIVVVPMGCGTNITAYAKGFAEYMHIGFIDTLPQLYGVQAEGAPSIVNSFWQGVRTITQLKKVDSIATAIAVNNPLDGTKALEAIYSTGGQGLAVSDTEMLQAQYKLAKEEGLFVETAAASSVAALFKYSKQSTFRGKTVVCVLTGPGLKDPDPILKIAIKPPTIRPSIEEFLSLYDNSFFDGDTISFLDKKAILYTTDPSIDELRAHIQKYLRSNYTDEYLRGFLGVINKFLQKGKHITFADLQDIVQDVLENLESIKGKVLTVTDFNVRTGKNRTAEAEVVVLLAGQELCAKGEGVGPVDAVINALRNACGSRIDFGLSHYRVDIRSQGTDAVVFVELRLTKEDHHSLGCGSSPDIIQASIEAFEKAYNGLPR